MFAAHIQLHTEQIFITEEITMNPDQIAPKSVCNIGHRSTKAEERADDNCRVNSGEKVMIFFIMHFVTLLSDFFCFVPFPSVFSEVYPGQAGEDNFGITYDIVMVLLYYF